MGSDIAKTINRWPDVDQLCSSNELVVGLRKTDTEQEINEVILSLSKKPVKYFIIKSPIPNITSSNIRESGQ
jgi:nicotinic acid mononucleotide adenylyltransferase